MKKRSVKMITLQHTSGFVTRLWKQRQQERAFTQAIQTVYTRWAARNRPWANAFFDEHFLLQRAALLEQYRLGKLGTEDSVLASQWADQFRFSAARRQQLVAELTPAAANFLYLLKVELCAREKRDRNGGWTLRFGDWAKRGQTL
jgi:hypothetical protein